MAERNDPGLFLERKSYRQRRLRDGLHVLPFVGAWLFLLPLLWVRGDEVDQGTAPALSSALYYVFGAWVVLIGLCAWLQARIDHIDGSPGTDGTPDAPDAPDATVSAGSAGGDGS